MADKDRYTGLTPTSEADPLQQQHDENASDQRIGGFKGGVIEAGKGIGDMFQANDVYAYSPDHDNFSLGGEQGYARDRANALGYGGQQVAGDLRIAGQQGMGQQTQQAGNYNAIGANNAASQQQLANNYATQGQQGNSMQQARALGFSNQGSQGAAQGVTRANTQQGQASNLSNGAFNQANGYGAQSAFAGQRNDVGVSNQYDNAQNRNLEAQGRAQQLQAAQSLGARANDGSGQQNTQGLRDFASSTGSGPSAAQSQLQTGSDQSMASSLALARSGRGNNTGAVRQAQFQNAATQQATNQQLGTLRAQEYDQAQNRQLGALNSEANAQLGYRGQDINALQGAAGVLGQSRGQDQSQQQLGIGQGQFDANLGLQNRQLNDATALGWAGQQQQASARGDANYFQGQQLGNQSIAQGQQYNAQLQGLGQQASQAGQTYDLGKGQLANQAIGQGQQAQLGFGSLANQATGQGQNYNAQMQGLGNQYSLGMQGLGQQALGQQLQGDMGYENLTSQNYMSAQQGNQQADTQRDAANVGLVGGMMQGMMMSDEHSKTQIRNLNGKLAQAYAALGGPSSERTDLSPEDEQAFQGWAKRQNVNDVDHPDSHYDYRGYWQGNPEANIRGGRDHFPDTYKQHGHPTFSGESRYSKSFADGGYWDDNEQYHPSAAPDVRQPDTGALDEAYQRQGDAPRVDLRPAQGYSYSYKDPNAPGAAPGKHYGPMAQDLERSPATASTVVTGPDGMKRVDPDRLTMVNTAALSDQQRDIQAIKQALATNNQAYDQSALDEAYQRQGGRVTQPSWRDQGPGF